RPAILCMNGPYGCSSGGDSDARSGLPAEPHSALVANSVATGGFMLRWFRPLIGAVLCAGLYAHAACDVTISPPTDVSATITSTAAGKTICLNPGTYSSSSFSFNNNVKVVGNAATPASVVLSASSGSIFAVNFGASGGTLQNLTIQGANGAISINGFNDITLKDLVATTVTGSVAHGVVLQNAARINVDNVSISSQFSGFLLINATSSVVMNSSVPKVQNAGGVGFAVFGGSNNAVVNNTFGSPKSGATYSLPSGGVVFYNSSGNRFENNVVQGFHDDGVDFTANDITNGPFSIPAAPTADNYIGKNTVISTGFADGLGAGSGIWSNCGGDNNWIYGNDVQGTPEESVVAFMTRSNAIAGLFVSGDSNTPAFCPAASATFQNVQPVDTFIKSNYIYFNLHDGAVIRDAAATEFSSNIVSAHNGLGGAIRANGTDMLGQSMLAFQSDSRAGFASNGLQVFANASHDNVRGFDNSLGSTPGVTFAYNR